jgi:hypothetical protein
VGLGAAALTLALGIVENVSYLGKRSDFDAAGRSGGACGSALMNRGGTGCSGLYDDMQGAKTGAIIGFAAAGLLGAGSAALFYFSSSNEHAEARVACAPRGLGAGCAVAF